jgi:hypothetical protein
MGRKSPGLKIVAKEAVTINDLSLLTKKVVRL